MGSHHTNTAGLLLWDFHYTESKIVYKHVTQFVIIFICLPVYNLLGQESCHLNYLKLVNLPTHPEPVILLKNLLSSYHMPVTESWFLPPTTPNTGSAEPQKETQAGATQRAIYNLWLREPRSGIRGQGSDSTSDHDSGSQSLTPLGWIKIKKKQATQSKAIIDIFDLPPQQPFPFLPAPTSNHLSSAPVTSFEPGSSCT